MKHTQVTEVDSRNTMTSKKLSVTFRAIWKPDSGSMVYSTYFFIKNNLLSYKN